MDLEFINSLYKFLVIDNFSGLTTVIAGAVAWYVYFSQKKDKKVNAARVILSEIRNAERRKDEISNALAQGLNDFPSILPINSWVEYSYLFASDFDQDELEEISAFYTFCAYIEDAVKKDNNYFWLTTEYRAQVIQEKLVDLVERSVITKTGKVDLKKLGFLKQSVLDTFASDGYSYSPIKTRNQLNSYISKVDKITTTTVGSKLKKIAGVK